VTVTVPLDLRTDIRPGDVGAVAHLHGREYWEEYGLDARFEAMVARGLARFVLATSEDPDAGRAWLAEDADGLAGCIAISRERESHGRVRWFLVARRARGQGLGRRLFDEALSYARARFSSLELETFSELTTAGQLYRSAGFELVSSTPYSGWGREIELQRYELRLGG
jgi:GNAT superfamily N-acetyltransferase